MKINCHSLKLLVLCFKVIIGRLAYLQNQQHTWHDLLEQEEGEHAAQCQSSNRFCGNPGKINVVFKKSFYGRFWQGPNVYRYELCFFLARVNLVFAHFVPSSNTNAHPQENKHTKTKPFNFYLGRDDDCCISFEFDVWPDVLQHHFL